MTDATRVLFFQNEAFIFYSGFTEKYLLPGHNLIINKLLERDFDQVHVSKKYANKKFLKASVFAIQWALANGTDGALHELDMVLAD